ncbi:hypothetical protein [Streptacidiphilus sp. P02-A3a]|uniref:hypothetical protein n=1 Tax=Streptacidiphilus sp. P02-A3a TaxID=2704468 RepID=UPI0015FC5BDD|nr:hypothetical protein [Streptacidiphilus sp. P02-A3a]QMU68352.1 hypothetical protein GXP74_09040 [Streptacidiphilus sp. P02-A3a]
MSDSEKQLRRQLVKAKEPRAEALREIDRLKADSEALVGALHQVVVEKPTAQAPAGGQAEQPSVLPTQPRPAGR